MNYTTIFEDIVFIMHHDYAGFMDKKGWDYPDRYRKILQEEKMDDLSFLALVQDYLYDFKEPHAFFTYVNKKRVVCGFEVRRIEDDLFITATPLEKRVKVGDKILQLDDLSIVKSAKKHHRLLSDDVKERQNWQAILNKTNTITLEKEDGTKEVVELNSFEPIEDTPIYTYETLNNNTALITLSDFMSESSVQSIIKTHQEALNRLENLIIDVRHNKGGMDTAYLPLLDYIFPKPFMYSELFENETMSINYTFRNTDLRIKEFESYLEHDLDDFTTQYLNTALLALKENRGKGLVVDENDLDFPIEGQAFPKHVYILSDVYCGSSGDMFVAVAKKSPKVTVVGRNTLGITDYSNLTTVEYGDFTFSYPTSRMNVLDENKGINGIGVEVDVYVPYTKAHLEKDVDLQIVLDLIKT